MDHRFSFGLRSGLFARHTIDISFLMEGFHVFFSPYCKMHYHPEKRGHHHQTSFQLMKNIKTEDKCQNFSSNSDLHTFFK